MTGFFWFLVAVLFFILYLSKKSPVQGDAEDYRHGYWDGYRALGSKIQAELRKGKVDRRQLEAFIAEGYPESEQPKENEVEAAEEQLQRAEVTVPQPPRELTPEQHEQKTIRNLNAILYVASFLLVAAAAVFVAASMPALVRLLGIWIVVALFYGAGLILHQKTPHLRPAAAAFLGTGLAIIPFAGYALHLIGDMPAQTAWLITSVVGLAAYFAAAVAIKSQLVSYLTMAFVLSLALSSVAVVSAPIVWYFVMLIGVSLVASSVSILRPTWLPELFRKPIEATGQIVTPIALLASIVVYDSMSLRMYELVFGVATAHYLVAWLQTRSYIYETVVRVLAHAAFLLAAYDITDHSVPAFALYWLILAGLQAGYSLWRLRTGKRSSEMVWLGILQGIILIGSVLWAGSEHVALGTLANFMTIGGISVLATLRLRQIMWAIPALVVSLVAPFIVGRWLAEPMWDWQLLAWVFMTMAASVIGVYYLVRAQRSKSVLRFLEVSFWLYIVFSVFTVFGQLSSTATGVIALFAALSAGLFSYVCRQAWGELAGGILYILAVGSLLQDGELHGWHTTAVILVSAASFYVVTYIHHNLHEVRRRNMMLGLGQAVLAGLLFNLWAEKEVVITSLSLMLAGSLGSFALRVMVQQKSAALQQIFSFSYFAYIVIAWLLVLNLESQWALLVYTIATMLFWAASYRERAPGLVIAGNITLVAAVATFWAWQQFNVDWITLGVAWIAAGILYFVYMLLDTRQDVWRQRACLISVWVLLGSASLLNFSDVLQAQAVAAAGTLLALAATIAMHGYKQRNRSTIELSLYIATVAAQRMVSLKAPGLEFVFYAHWWALTIGLAAWWRRAEGNVKQRLVIAVAFITAGSGLKALEEGGWYQLLFLAEHAALLVIGALRQAAWALWWGVAAVIVAVLYFLRDYPYMALAFLGLVLIAIVIWRLSRSRKEHEEK